MKRIIMLLTGCLLTANALFAFTRQDTLRGSNGPGRNWWNVQQYQLRITMDTASRTISGSNKMTFHIPAAAGDSMQIDLQQPMVLDSVFLSTDDIFPENRLSFFREGNVFWITGLKSKGLKIREQNTMVLYYHGQPRAAVNPPWDGGFIWTRDNLGNPWISVACQGLGASSWWPCKDDQSDEPDSGVVFRMKAEGIPEIISNGPRELNNTIQYIKMNKEGTDAVAYAPEPFSEYYQVRNPINTYDVCFYAGNYSLLSDTFKSQKGILSIYAAPLYQNAAKMSAMIPDIKMLLTAFEYWFGPYPFYEDNYKIVEAPFLGMEHQGAIAYGNGYQPGYKGKDRSGTGVGLLFDFILVHESGHEWFGNSITAADIADNWIHEGFTTYSETLYAEYWFGKEKAFAYCRGEWKNIRNDIPVIGTYGVHDGGSSDKYDKGSALIHTIRLLMNDDERFRMMLHKMNETFYHRQVSSRQMEDFITDFSGLRLTPVFNQYLRTTLIPQLEWRTRNKTLEYRFTNISEGFELPVPVSIDGKIVLLRVNAQWQTQQLERKRSRISFEPHFLLHTVKL